MTKRKTVLKWLILAIPYLIYVIRMLLQVVDELAQSGSFWILRKWNLIELVEKPTKPDVKI